MTDTGIHTKTTTTLTITITINTTLFTPTGVASNDSISSSPDQILPSSQQSVGTAVGIGVTIAIVVILLLFLIFIGAVLFIRKRKRDMARFTSKNVEYADDSPSSTPPEKNHKHKSLEHTNTPEASLPTFGGLLKDFEIPFSHLKITKELGSGNLGVVYLASYDDERVALKQFKPKDSAQAADLEESLRQQTQTIKDFVAESAVLAQLPHSPYVIQLIGLCREPFCMVTEYIEGGSLVNYLKDWSIQISTDTSMTFLKQIMTGLRHLHKNGIIHRDLAARNIMLRASQEDDIPECVLVDIGLGRLNNRGTSYLKTKTATVSVLKSGKQKQYLCVLICFS